MKLYYREFGKAGGQPPLVLLHGLLGSLVNWQRIARKLAERHRVIVPDLRNHGRSPHHPDVSYPAMGGDVLELLDDLGLGQAVLIGHSMGGKVAMWLALSAPARVSRLVVADIAPVTYANGLRHILALLLELPLDEIDRREAADRWLARELPDRAVRDYLLQNLVRSEVGWRWRADIRALHDGMDQIGGFPPLPEDARYDGPTLLIHGTRSDYVRPEYLDLMYRRFPKLEVVGLDAGHWVYAEQPTAFVQAVERFLDQPA